MSNITVRKLRLHELPQLLEFRRHNDYEAYPAKETTKESLLYSVLKFLWHGERMATLVAVREDVILGYVTLVFGRHAKFRGNAYLVSVAVKASERGRGLGTLLFAEVEKYALSRGARRIEFEVFAKNTGALNLYRRIGYEVEGTKRRAVEFAGEYDDLIFMAKILNTHN